MKANDNLLANKLVTKRFVTMIAKFNEELNAFAQYCGEDVATLYEDICTDFTLSNVRIDGNKLVYDYDGREEYDIICTFCDYVKQGEEKAAIEDGNYYDYIDEIKDTIKFWRARLRRARRYWATDCDTLDKMADNYINGVTSNDDDESDDDNAESNDDNNADESNDDNNANAKYIAVADKQTERQEILQRIEKGFNKTLNSCIAVTLANYFDTITNIKDNDFTKDVYTWYDNALKSWNM